MHPAAADQPPFLVPNYPGYKDQVDKCREALAEDVACARLVPPPAGVAAPYVHPMSAVPKGENGVRVIHDYSAPSLGALNNSQQFLYIQPARIDRVQQQLQVGDFMAKADIYAYFRSFPVNPSHWPLLALQHDGDWLWDTRVPFGARNAPEVACRVSAAVRDKLIGWGVRVVLDVVDDFLLIEREPGRVAVAFCLLVAPLCALGFVISWSKCVVAVQ